ncbi:MAG: GGDEF domain-containing protein [Candidatus Rokubacteria bacterium]|nr:GGDEF domain-containing protein [Candidatus Rokubacteria bacterium]
MAGSNPAVVWFQRLRVRQRVGLALVPALAGPALALGYTLYALSTGVAGRAPGGLAAVWIAAGLAVSAGALMLWQLARQLARAARTVEALGITPAEAPPATPPDGLDTPMSAFSRLLATVEQQAADINQYAMRLDNAYKAVESTSAQLKELSFKDPVTGLYNRRFFAIRLEEEVSRFRRFDHPVSVLFLDVDEFKEVNDRLGHAAGDETLRDLGDILLRNSRGINVICRYGGDEFAVLLVETSKAGARLYADRIRLVLASHRFPHGRRVTASIGIAALPEDVGPVADDLLRAADEALYAAKRAGRNRVAVYDEVGAAPRAGETGVGRGRV